MHGLATTELCLSVAFAPAVTQGAEYVVVGLMAAALLPLVSSSTYVIAVLRNALVLVSVPSEHQQIVLGGVLLLAMGLERARSTGISSPHGRL
jgi:ABC-type xylose transport system permease subunit